MNVYLKDILDQPGELKKVLKSLNEEYSKQVGQVAALLKLANEIVLTSMGSAYYSLIPMYYALVRRGYAVSLIEASELLRNQEQLDSKKLYVFMSRSGESYEVALLSRLMKKKNITSVGITMTPESTMARYVTYMLHDCASYDAMVCTKAYTSLALCGLKCVDAMEKETDNTKITSALEHMFEWLDQNKESIFEQISRLDVLKDAPNFCFLSRSYGMGVIKSGALWMEEVARKCVSVSSLDTFYHGPIELSRTNIVPVFLGVEMDDRSDLIFEIICSLTDKMICICPENAAMEKGIIIRYPEFQVEPEYQMLMLAFYFQFLSYCCALENGIEPGKMETLTWVVK